jgi:phytoene desaturase
LDSLFNLSKIVYNLPSTMKKVIVIGAGFSGLSAASYLARDGYDVTVIEKNDLVGGRARKFETGGFLFDMGPSWYWMPEVFENYFNDFGKKVSDFYELIRLDPGYRMVFSKEEHIDVPAGIDDLYGIFNRIEPGSADRLRSFLDKSAVKYDIGINQMVKLPGNSIFEFFNQDLIMGMIKMDALTPLSRSVSKVVKDHRLVQLLEFPVLFLGATASETPALYSLMNYADLVLGTWYPMGGMFRVIEGMENLARSLGVKIITGNPVAGINIKGSRTTGVFAGEKEYPADIVVGSADYQFIDQNLLPETHRGYTRKYWETRKMAPSALMYYLGLDTRVQNLEHHNLFFDEDYRKHAADIYEHPAWPEKPAIYVSCTSLSDPSTAPEGMENVTVLIPVAPGLEDTPEIREKYYGYVMDKLEHITGQELKSHVIFQRSYAQSDFISDYNSFKGNAYGLANTLRQTAILKPKMKSRKVDNLFYTGQLTVPGPGVPPALISGKVVAGEVASLINP